MEQRVIDELAREEQTPFHLELRDRCVDHVRRSRAFMCQFYSKWDDRERVYRSWRQLDEEDKKAIQEGRPRKQVLPMTWAKVQTFMSFMLSTYFQRARFFELEPQGVEDQDGQELAESLLNYDVRHAGIYLRVRQHIKDIARYGIGIIKSAWEQEFTYVPREVMQGGTMIFGTRIGGTRVVEMQAVPKHQGNRLKVISPFTFFPDTRFPLSEFQRGEFCADEDDISLGDLYRLEAEKTAAGIKYVEPFVVSKSIERGVSTRRSSINWSDPTKTKELVRLTEIQIKLVPHLFKLADGKPLGDAKVPTKYIVWIANDDRIIRCEPMGYLHDQFTYDIGQFDEDEIEFCGASLCDVLDRGQETMDWFLNSRVASVSRTIDNQLVVDPLGVDMTTINNRSRVILLKKGASRTGVDRYVKQLQVNDVTARHMEDIGQLNAMMNGVSGINENAQGQYHSGRRSATEARVVTQGASARLKTIAESVWQGCYVPLGQKLLSNLRQGLTPENIIQYAGTQYANPEKQLVVTGFKATPEEIARSCDYFVYDGTLASEKAYMAQSLMELLNNMMTLGPTGLLTLELSPKLILQKVYQLLGLGDVSEFSLMRDPQTLQRLVEQMLAQAMGQANGTGNEQGTGAGGAGGTPPV